MSWSSNDWGENGSGCVVSGETGLAHAGPVVHHQSSWVVVAHVERVWSPTLMSNGNGFRRLCQTKTVFFLTSNEHRMNRGLVGRFTFYTYENERRRRDSDNYFGGLTLEKSHGFRDTSFNVCFLKHKSLTFQLNKYYWSLDSLNKINIFLINCNFQRLFEQHLNIN